MDFNIAEFKGATEHKEFEFEIKAINDDGSFKGYAAVYGNVDLGGDTIEPFAAKRSLKATGGKMPILRNHSAKIEDIVGENISGTEDDNGFKVEGKLDLSRESGRDTHQAIKFAKEAGRKMGLSIGFIPNWKKVDYVEGVRHLKEIHIIEYSVVVFPMNPKAKISSIKSFCEKATAEDIALKKREFERALRDVGASQKEQKAAVDAIFTQREVDKEAEAKAKEQEEKAKEELMEALENLQGIFSKK
jgi:HK97 family phage prohead protease